MKLNIQKFAKIKENENGNLTENEELNSADKIAELTIDLDLEKEKNEKLQKDFEELTKKYDDEHKANIRLMNRINERDERNEEKEIKNKESQKAKITDLYDFKSGKLVLK